MKYMVTLELVVLLQEESIMVHGKRGEIFPLLLLVIQHLQFLLLVISGGNQTQVN
jgi:hypothetical protein